MAKASPAASHTARPASLRSSSRAAASGSSSAIPRPPLPAAVNTRDVSSNCKGVAKRLDYDDNFAFPDALAVPDDDDLAPLLVLPDPADSFSSSSSSTLVSATLDDAVTASADSAHTQVACHVLGFCKCSRWGFVWGLWNGEFKLRFVSCFSAPESLQIHFAAPSFAGNFACVTSLFLIAFGVLFEVTAGETNEMVEEEEPLPDQVNLALAELHGGRGLSPRSKRLIADVLELLAAERNPTATTLRLRAAFWGKRLLK
uniref:Uncharacterized protein n=1 Tax=Oryza brachyantha TaxID=4533 RepID=J3LIL0_ORYBR